MVPLVRHNESSVYQSDLSRTEKSIDDLGSIGEADWLGIDWYGEADWHEEIDWDGEANWHDETDLDGEADWDGEVDRSNHNRTYQMIWEHDFRFYLGTRFWWVWFGNTILGFIWDRV